MFDKSIDNLLFHLLGCFVIVPAQVHIDKQLLRYVFRFFILRKQSHLPKRRHTYQTEEVYHFELIPLSTEL